MLNILRNILICCCSDAMSDVGGTACSVSKPHMYSTRSTLYMYR